MTRASALPAALSGSVVMVGVAVAGSKLGLPLTNADVIHKQAAEKHLDPSLIAAVIYAETKFDPRPSPAGA